MDEKDFIEYIILKKSFDKINDVYKITNWLCLKDFLDILKKTKKEVDIEIKKGNKDTWPKPQETEERNR